MLCGLAKLGNIVAETTFLVMFPEGWLNWETFVSDAKFVSGAKVFLTSWQKHFFVSEQQNLFSQHVSREAKLGNICVPNNVF